MKPGRPRRRFALAAYFTAGAVVFFFFLVASFPYNATISSMLAPYHLKLTYDYQRISPPLGAKLINVSLEPIGADPADALLQSPEVTLAPTMAALFLGRPGLRVNAHVYDGLVKVTIHQRAGITDVAFNLSGINPAQCVPLRTIGAIVEGRIGGTGSATIGSQDLPDNSAQMTLDAQQVAITVINGIGFPPVELGHVTGNLQLAQGALAIDHFESEGGDAELEADGSIQIGPTLAGSTIELHFLLKPTPAGQDHLGFFLNFLPHHDDPDTPYVLSGPLLSPSLS
ncbi:MAG: type II secretion system protein GspN [Candidatus Binataceae bacterium]|jgi:type II secretion system protein N